MDSIFSLTFLLRSFFGLVLLSGWKCGEHSFTSRNSCDMSRQFTIHKGYMIYDYEWCDVIRCECGYCFYQHSLLGCWNYSNCVPRMIAVNLQYEFDMIWYMRMCDVMWCDYIKIYGHCFYQQLLLGCCEPISLRPKNDSSQFTMRVCFMMEWSANECVSEWGYVHIMLYIIPRSIGYFLNYSKSIHIIFLADL